MIIVYGKVNRIWRNLEGGREEGCRNGTEQRGAGGREEGRMSSWSSASLSEQKVLLVKIGIRMESCFRRKKREGDDCSIFF